MGKKATFFIITAAAACIFILFTAFTLSFLYWSLSSSTKTEATGLASPPPRQVVLGKNANEEEVITPDQVASVRRGLESGNIAFNAPERMTLESATTVHLILHPSTASEELKKMIEASAEGKREGDSVQISNLMQASLAGAGFRITDITPAEQAVSRDIPTEWKWEVEPTRPGRHKLHLTLTANVSVRGSKLPLRLRTFDKTIDVEVSGLRAAFVHFRENWEWAWTLIVFPVVAWWVRRRNKAPTGQAAEAPAAGESKEVEKPPAPEARSVEAAGVSNRQPLRAKPPNRKSKRPR